MVDDIGMLPVGQAAAEALYRLIDAAYEHRALAEHEKPHTYPEAVKQAQTDFAALKTRT